VSLWQKASEPAIRSFLLKEPRTALQNARPEKSQAPVDPRLSHRGKVLARALPLLRGVAMRVSDALQPAPERSDLKLLAGEMKRTASVLPGLVTALGSAGKCASFDNSDEPSGTPTSDGCSVRATASRVPPGRQAST
jgi:hypothetical protein